VDYTDDVTIQDLHIKNSGGIGIITNNTGDSNVYRCTLEYTATVGIMIQDATGGTIEDNDLEEVAMAYRSCTPSITTSGGLPAMFSHAQLILQ
jgi:parallel beta-helix repeat protein